MKLSTALAKSPVADDQKNITRPWIRFFGDLVDAITGTQDKVTALDAIAPPIVTLVTTHTLTADTTLDSPSSPLNGQFWIARVDQDAAGGWVVTWGADTVGGPVVDVTPSTMSIQTFFGSGGKWLPAGAPILGVPIP